MSGGSAVESPERAAGILLHPSSLPGPAIGSVGAEARRFVDWLAGAGQGLWQILPLVPVGGGGSPYDGLSAFGGNPLLADLEALERSGLLREGMSADAPPGSGPVDYPSTAAWKESLLGRAWEAFREGAAPELRGELERFHAAQAYWLDDYALFRALREERGGAGWTTWEEGLRSRRPAALSEARERLRHEIGRRVFEQYVFERQWSELRRYARDRGIRIIGDVPIFVSHDSADVWANPDLFRLDESGAPEVVAGVPPDYFSETGQRWGNPLYRWDRMRERRYAWWSSRFRRTLEQVDIARVDHFRGFEAFWEVPAEEETALNGRWRPGPGRELFDVMRVELGDLPLIAEDLGLITPEVEALRDALRLPGMRVLQFAFDGDPDNPHLPENHPERSVAYTGTHDNDTVLGWMQRGAGEAERKRLRERFRDPAGEVNWEMIRMVHESAARFAVVPMQDVLGLGSAARMNVPGRAEGNWSWRMAPAELTPAVRDRLLASTRAGDRVGLAGSHRRTHAHSRES